MECGSMYKNGGWVQKMGIGVFQAQLVSVLSSVCNRTIEGLTYLLFDLYCNLFLELRKPVG